jgi:hypothetical protein
MSKSVNKNRTRRVAGFQILNLAYCRRRPSLARLGRGSKRGHARRHRFDPRRFQQGLAMKFGMFKEPLEEITRHAAE